MTVNYGEKFTEYLENAIESAKFAWKYKVLWVFGFIMALFSGGYSSNTNTGDLGDSSSWSGSGTSDWDGTGGDVGEFGQTVDDVQDGFISAFESPWFWIGLVAVMVLIIALAFLQWYLLRVAKISLINAVKHDLAKKPSEIKLKKLWSESHNHIGRLFAFDLLWLGFYLAAAIVVGIPAALIVMLLGPAAIVLICCFGVFIGLAFLLVGVVISAVKTTAVRLMVLEDMGVIDSLKRGWEIFKKDFLLYVIAWMVQVVPRVVVMIINLFVVVLALVVVVFIAIGMVVAGQYILAVLLGICSLCGLVILVSVLLSPFMVAIETYWTKFLMSVMKKK